ncbi:hypothetical protein HDU91_003961, partial [Kappamyces sp. JEL0680]
RLFERALSTKWSSKKMKFFFKKYLEFEKKKGTPEGVDHVKAIAVAYFFRWMSERYPLCSELIDKKRIPEYDNLYLDMNGYRPAPDSSIIHNCSHPNDDDPMFRITETQIFLSIFSYIGELTLC